MKHNQHLPEWYAIHVRASTWSNDWRTLTVDAIITTHNTHNRRDRLIELARHWVCTITKADYIIGHAHILLICLCLLAFPDRFQLSAWGSRHNASELWVAQMVGSPVQKSLDICLTDATYATSAGCWILQPLHMCASVMSSRLQPCQP